MSRIPPVPRSQLNDEQQATHDIFTSAGQAAFSDSFIWQRKSDQALVGPYPAFLAHPDVGAEFMKFFGLVAKIPGLPSDARETAILVVGAHFKAAYELYAHQAIAAETTDLTLEQSKRLAAGVRPTDLSENCKVAYDVATHLATRPGPLSQELWDKSLKTFGKDGTLALVHYTGFYAYVSMLLNAIDALVPHKDE